MPQRLIGRTKSPSPELTTQQHEFCLTARERDIGCLYTVSPTTLPKHQEEALILNTEADL